MLLTVAALLGIPATVPGREPEKPRNRASLQEQLESGLRATRPDEKEWLAHVVDMVVEEELPLSLVNAVYKWAVQQRRAYPFPYFKRGLTELAKKRGIEI
jgi:hypothetical protein